MSVLRRRAILAGATAAALGAPAIANAQADWPKGTIKFVVPFPPGGSTDPIARIIQAKIIEQTGWNIVVDNKPGGSGVVGAAIAAKSPPDGNTWLIVFDNHILNSLLNDNLPYKDGELTPVMQIGRSAQGIAAHPTRPYNTFAEAIKAAKAEPGKISIGSLGSSLAQIFIAFLQKENGFQMNYIPYKGGGPLYQDALAGVTDLSVTSLANMMPHVRAGKLKLVGVTGDNAQQACARHAHPRATGRQGAALVLLVGRLCADRNAQADRRQDACGDLQGGAHRGRHQEVRRPVRHGDRAQLSRGLRRLRQEGAGALGQGHQGQQPQGGLGGVRPPAVPGPAGPAARRSPRRRDR